MLQACQPITREKMEEKTGKQLTLIGLKITENMLISLVLIYGKKNKKWRNVIKTEQSMFHQLHQLQVHQTENPLFPDLQSKEEEWKLQLFLQL